MIIQKSLCSLAVWLFSVCAAFAEEPKYPVSLIPKELLENVNVVVRSNKTVFSIINDSSAVHSTHEVYTILNPEAKEFAVKALFYSKLEKVKSLEGNLYDGNGNLIKRLKNWEIYDQSVISGYSLYEDNRVKVADLSYGSYPYTVEFICQTRLKFLFYIPSFYVRPGEKIAIEKANFSIDFSKDAVPPRYETLNIEKTSPTISSSEGRISWSWSFENVKGYQQEPFGPTAEEASPIVMAAPTQFNFEGNKGQMNDWNHFGEWINSLSKERKKLPAETAKLVENLVKGVESQEEKIRILYEYMQSKTRYVSIQIGIGGFQPFEASVVDKVGYGDCKALSNYMVALLEAAGIKSNYTLIRAGKDAQRMISNFPSSQFNHAVVSVPLKSDTIWLECTSQTNPFGYAGTFTGNREALAINEKEAVVVKTPEYNAEKNVQSRMADIYLQTSGDGIAEIISTYSGLQYETNQLNWILDKQIQEKQKWLYENTKIPNFNIISFSINATKDIVPVATVSMKVSLPKYASTSGKRFIFKPNLMNRSTLILQKNENRKQEVICKTASTDVDTIRFNLPEGIYPEFLPKPISLKSQFGTYEAVTQLSFDGKVVYTRKLILFKGNYPSTKYADLVDFYNTINKADDLKLVFLKKT
jgi:Domain of Unknown Function with PDB structure (DUF3857)/Transglutaminase-like superfamily